MQGALPSGLDLSPKYTLRLLALDPATGNTVPNVTIGTTVLTATVFSPADAQDIVTGDWQLVPGPLA
jgi:hypothetical protein